MPTKIDLDELSRLYPTLGYRQLAHHFGCSQKAVFKAVKKLGLTESGRRFSRKLDPEVVVPLYLEGKGLIWISKLFDCNEQTVRRLLVREGVLDSSRQYVASGSSRRARRQKAQEFTDATKRLRFEQENGVCQECGSTIDNWRQATYHHIRLCRDGGGAEPENCMVLHFECHNDPEVFKRLHGFSVSYLSNYQREVAQPGQSTPFGAEVSEVRILSSRPVLEEVHQ